MFYLTRVIFDAHLLAKLRIRDSHDWHQRAWECFPGRDGQPRDFLTRLEEGGSFARMLLLSPTPPTRPCWCAPDAWQGPKPIGETFLSHRLYRFQLCANPTRKVKAFKPDGMERPNGRREPLRTREELVGWIRRKGEAGGFKVDEATLRTFPRGRESFVRQGKAGLHSAVEFQGVLTVADRQRFGEAFARGIGSAKAFGFGMLTLVPLKGEVSV